MTERAVKVQVTERLQKTVNVQVTVNVQLTAQHILGQIIAGKTLIARRDDWSYDVSLYHDVMSSQLIEITPDGEVHIDLKEGVGLIAVMMMNKLNLRLVD